MVKKERIPWLDYVRFFSIFLVILFHTPPQTPILDGKIIINLRIPLFFCISGYLFNIAKYSSFGQFFKHRGKQILVPYVTFFVVFYALWLMVGAKLGDANVAWWQPLVDFVKGEPHTVLGTFWYLSCLLVMQVLYYFMQRWLRSQWVFPASIMLSVAAINCPIENYWHVWNAMVYMPFYAFGNSFKKYIAGVEFSSKRRTTVLLALGIVSLVAMALSIYIEEKNSMNVIKIACGVMVIPTYIAIAKWLAARYGRNRVIQLVVMNGTVYLAFQNHMIGFIKVMLERFFYVGVMNDHMWLKFLIPIFVMVAIYPFAWIIHNYAPWMLGKKKEEVLTY